MASRPFFAADLTALIQAGFETLTEAGYSPEMAYFECLHEMKLIVDLLYEGGIRQYAIFDFEHGGIWRSYPRQPGRHRCDQSRMKKILGEIQSGEFADEWMSECDNGKENFKRLEGEGEKHEIEEVGKNLRQMMPWLKEKALVNKQVN